MDRQTLATGLAHLTPQKRAELIYAQARSELNTRLWRAALGDVDGGDKERSPLGQGGLSTESLLSLISGQGGVGAAACPCGCGADCPCHRGAHVAGDVDAFDPVGAVAGTSSGDDPVLNAARSIAGLSTATADGTDTTAGDAAGLALGVNSRFSGVLAQAGERSGIPSNVIAAIVDAEAGKHGDGSWNMTSRNPRSSAAGLGQFLSGTWVDMAQRDGTWLNDVAKAKGWLDASGRVTSAARTDLLALRYDARASIETVADYAKGNLDRLERAGFSVRSNPETLAKAAYLSHHLGLGDTQRFLGGGIDAGRARTLLVAQIGSSAANERIAQAGNATRAHREWLIGYINRRIQPGQFNG
ncbi:MAG: peptidoglycan-binding protein [Sphingomonas sp.]|nr:peptidoglycan-binding protein [Sphingomonas sp.]